MAPTRWHLRASYLLLIPTLARGPLAAQAATGPSPGMSVRGTIVNADGTPAHAHTVVAVCKPSKESPAEASFTEASQPSARDGSFALLGLPAGVCTLMAVDPNGHTCSAGTSEDGPPTISDPCSRTEMRVTILPGGDVTDVRLGAPVVSPDEDLKPTTVEGRVLDAENRPLKGYDIAADCTKPDTSPFETSTGLLSSAESRFSIEIRGPTGTICYLRPYRCRSMADCDAAPCEGTTSGCVRVELSEGTTVPGIVLHPVGN
jgi:hypothetical protein